VIFRLFSGFFWFIRLFLCQQRFKTIGNPNKLKNPKKAFPQVSALFGLRNFCGYRWTFNPNFFKKILKSEI